MEDNEKEFQQIRDIYNFEDLEFEPPHPKKIFTPNIVHRTLAWLVGWYGKDLIRVQVTSDGALKTAEAGLAIEHNETFAGTGSDTDVESAFTTTSPVIDVFVWDFPAIFKRSNNGTTYDSDIEIPAGTMYSFDCRTKSTKIKNKTAGSNARWQIVGWN